MKGRSVVVVWVLLGCLLAGCGCQGSSEEKAKLESELAQVKANLEKAVSEKDSLRGDVIKLQEALNKAESGLASVSEIRDNLQKQVDELAGSRDELRQQVDELGRSHRELQSRVELMVAVRDAAMAEAKQAQVKVEELTSQLQAQVQQAKDLREQIKTIRAVLEQLQNKTQ